MPAYGTQNPPPAIFPAYPQSQAFLFNNEAVVASETSQQVHVPPGQTDAARGLRISGKFNAAPGTFELDIVESDQDVLGVSSYTAVPTGSTINSVGSDGVSFAVDLINFSGQFVALFVKTAPTNSNIKVTAVVTRS